MLLIPSDCLDLGNSLTPLDPPPSTPNWFSYFLFSNTIIIFISLRLKRWKTHERQALVIRWATWFLNLACFCSCVFAPPFCTNYNFAPNNVSDQARHLRSRYTSTDWFKWIDRPSELGQLAPLRCPLGQCLVQAICIKPVSYTHLTLPTRFAV